MWQKIQALLVGVSLGTLLIAGCTQYASQQELTQLENQRKAALAAEQKVQECEQMRADMERQVKEKQAVIDKLTRDRDAVKE